MEPELWRQSMMKRRRYGAIAVMVGGALVACAVAAGPEAATWGPGFVLAVGGVLCAAGGAAAIVSTNERKP